METVWTQLMKILIFSDVHRSASDSFNLLEAKDTLLRQTIQFYIDRVDFIIHGGDGFDARAYDSKLATTEARIYQEATGGKVGKIYICSGNHDSRYREFSPLSPYGVGAKINIIAADPHEIICEDGNVIVIQGWAGQDKLPEPLSKEFKKAFYFGHVNVADWLPNGKGIKLNELVFSPYHKHFFGDYHQHRIDGTVISIGTMFPSDFKDKDCQGGFLIYDTDTDKIERKVFPPKVYPIFKIFEITAENEADFFERITAKDIEHNIVRAILSGTPEWLVKAVNRVEALKDFKPRHFETRKISASKGKKVLLQGNPLTIDKRKLLSDEATRQGWEAEVLKLAEELI